MDRINNIGGIMKRFMSMFFIYMLANMASANSVQIELENDTISGNDKHYTHGTRITYEKDDLNWFIQQNMYTPDDISVEEPIVYDRPYAGVLFGGIRGTKRWKNPKADSGYRKIYHQLEASLGVVGDNSLAGKTQRTIHSLTGNTYPSGWNNQVDDMLWAQLGIRFCIEEFTSKYFNSRFMFIGDAGTVMSDVGFGGLMMLGYNVPRFIDKPMTSKINECSIYLFYENLQKHMFYNKLLESDYTDINMVGLVGETRIGAGIQYKRVKIQYSVCERTREFFEQDENSKFGSVSIRVDI